MIERTRNKMSRRYINIVDTTTGPADMLPALARLSLVGLLPSRARLRFTEQRHCIEVH